MNPTNFYTRRDWLQKAGAGFGGLGLASLLADEGLLILPFLSLIDDLFHQNFTKKKKVCKKSN